MKKILIGISAVLVLALAAVAMAAHPGGGPHGKMKMRGGHGEMHGEMMEAHFAALGLTEDQKAAAKQLHEELRAKAEPLMEQVRERHEALQTMLDGANPDPATVGNQVIAAHQTRTQLKALHEDFKTRFTALLTDEQKEKLEQFHERHGDPERPTHSRASSRTAAPASSAPAALFWAGPGPSTKPPLVPGPAAFLVLESRLAVGYPTERRPVGRLRIGVEATNRYSAPRQGEVSRYAGAASETPHGASLQWGLRLSNTLSGPFRLEHALEIPARLRLRLFPSISSTPASRRASFFYSSSICRPIWMRCACGEPAPCIDSVR